MKNYVLAFICVAGGLASGCLEIEINKDSLNCHQAGGALNSQTGKCESTNCKGTNGTLEFDKEKNKYICPDDYCSEAGGTLEFDEEKNIYICTDNYCSKAGGTFNWTKNKCEYCSEAEDSEAEDILDSATDECKTLKQKDETQFKDSIRDCKTNGGILTDFHVILTENVELSAEDFGKCDLVNSTILGSKDSSIITITVPENVTIKDALFKNIKDSTIKNIKFDYDVNYENIEIEWNGDSVDDTTDGKGIIAHKISNSELSEIEILGNLSLENIKYNEKNIGGIAGVVQDSILKNINFVGNITINKINEENKSFAHGNIRNIGGLVGQCVGECHIHNANIKPSLDNEDLIYIQDEENSNESEEVKPIIENVGGLVGYLRQSDTIQKKSSELIGNNVYGKIAIDANDYNVHSLGGQFGSIQTSFDQEETRFSTISDSKFKGCISIGSLSIDNGDRKPNLGAFTAYAIGGFAGKIEGSDITNIYTENKGSCDDYGIQIHTIGLETEIDTKELYSMYYIGGLIGALNKSSISNSTTSADLRLQGQIINRVGGAFGGTWISTIDDVKNYNNDDKVLDLDIEINSIPFTSDDNPNKNIIYLGGFVGKSSYSYFLSYHNNAEFVFYSCNNLGSQCNDNVYKTTTSNFDIDGDDGILKNGANSINYSSFYKNVGFYDEKTTGIDNN